MSENVSDRSDDQPKRTGEVSLAFTAAPIDHSEAPTFSLATIAVEATPSMARFGLHEALVSAVMACKEGPGAERLLLRVVLFSTGQGGIREVHGFIPVAQIDTTTYARIKYEGMSPLVDAMFNAVGATITFGTEIIEKGGVVNGSVIVLTDGYNSRSRATPETVSALAADWRTTQPKQLKTLLLGVSSGRYRQYLGDLAKSAAFDSYVQVETVLEGWMQRLATHIVTIIQVQCTAITGLLTPVPQHA